MTEQPTERRQNLGRRSTDKEIQLPPDIIDRLGNLEDKVDKVYQANCEEKTQHTDILKWINGNGEPGAKVKLAILYERWDKMEKQLTELNNGIRAFIVAIGLSVLLYLLTNVLPQIIQHLGVKPIP